MVGPPRPPPLAGFFPPLEAELISDEVGDRGRGEWVGFGSRFASRRLVCTRGVEQLCFGVGR